MPSLSNRIVPRRVETCKAILNSCPCSYSENTILDTPPSVLEQKPETATRKMVVKNYWSPLYVRQRQAQWAYRCSEELAALLALRSAADDTATALTNDSPYHAWFVTLTYDDEHLPLTSMEDFGSLRSVHISMLMKHCRHYCDKHGISMPSYMGAGEYGENSHRPHYHLVLIGCSFDFVRNLAEWWRSRHCPKSKQYSKDLMTVDIDELDKLEKGDLVGVDVRLIGNTLKDAKKVGTYVGKYAAKGCDTWYRELQHSYDELVIDGHLEDVPFRKVMEKPFLIRPSRYFGLGVGLLETIPENKTAKLEKKVDEMLAQILNSSVSKTLDNKHYNEKWLQSVTEHLYREDANGFTHKLPPYFIRLCMPKEQIVWYEEQTKLTKDKYGLKLPKTQLCRRSYTIQYDLEGGVRVNSQIPLQMPIVYALGYYSQIASLRNTCDVYRDYLPVAYDLPSSTPEEDTDFLVWLDLQKRATFAERVHEALCSNRQFYRRCKW